VRLLGGLDALIQQGQKLDIFPPVGGGRHSHGTFSRARLV
jgi:hypothetical protein